jgi:hypothetical protein
VKRTFVLWSLVVLLAHPLWAHDQASIELLAPDLSCNLIITPENPTGSFSIVVVGGATATCCPGFTGAEFRVIGLNGDWLVLATPNPSATVMIGNPLRDGTNIAFSHSLMDPSVLLFSVSLAYIGAGDPPASVLQVVAHRTPSNPLWPCPKVVGGGGCPCWAFACATGGFLYINGDGDCLVGVTPLTWSGVKALYGR